VSHNMDLRGDGSTGSPRSKDQRVSVAWQAVCALSSRTLPNCPEASLSLNAHRDAPAPQRQLPSSLPGFQDVDAVLSIVRPGAPERT